MWNAHLEKYLKKTRFTQSKVDKCVYTRDNLVFMVFVDDGILITKIDSAID